MVIGSMLLGNYGSLTGKIKAALNIHAVLAFSVQAFQSNGQTLNESKGKWLLGDFAPKMANRLCLRFDKLNAYGAIPNVFRQKCFRLIC